MALLMFRTFGVIIVSFIVLIMYVLHRKKNGKFIKRKAVNEEEKIKYQKWEKIINVMAVVGLLILGIFITVPCCLDIPYLKQLSERNRETLLMYYFLEMNNEEIAKKQNISRSGVFQNRHNSLALMKKLLKEKQ